MREIFDDIADGYRALGMAPNRYLTLTSAEVLMQEERWAEARATLEAIDPASFETPRFLMSYENNLAWVLAHDGAAAEAVEIVQRALSRAPSVAASQEGPLDLSNLDGTLGAALTLDGRPAAAVMPLRRAIATESAPRSQAIHHYYLGAALFALGEVSEARRVWEEARALAPATTWGRLAAQRLAADVPSAYR